MSIRNIIFIIMSILFAIGLLGLAVKGIRLLIACYLDGKRQHDHVKNGETNAIEIKQNVVPPASVPCNWNRDEIGVKGRAENIYV